MTWIGTTFLFPSKVPGNCRMPSAEPMRRLRYHVAMSLDGFIAGPKGEYDWILMDPTVDFMAFYSQFDTAVMGRRTFELALTGPGAIMPGLQTIVCSRTLR